MDEIVSGCREVIDIAIDTSEYVLNLVRNDSNWDEVIVPIIEVDEAICDNKVLDLIKEVTETESLDQQQKNYLVYQLDLFRTKVIFWFYRLLEDVNATKSLYKMIPKMSTT